MARNLRGLSLSLFLVSVTSGFVAPAFARDADDVLLPFPMQVSATSEMALVRPMPRPDQTVVAYKVPRNTAAVPIAIMAPKVVDRPRIRQPWLIGVFR